MRLGVVIAAVVTTCVAQVAASGPENCTGCESPTGCPGLCAQSGGQSFCKGYCGDPGMSLCGACAGQSDEINCFFDTSGENCFLEVL